MTNKDRQKRYREKQKALRALHDVTKKGETVTESVTDMVKTVTPVTEVYDKEEYENRQAWEVAVVRAKRARRYAEMFPQFIKSDDLKYQEVGWQYFNEGLPSVSKLVSGNPS